MLPKARVFGHKKSLWSSKLNTEHNLSNIFWRLNNFCLIGWKGDCLLRPRSPSSTFSSVIPTAKVRKNWNTCSLPLLGCVRYNQRPSSWVIMCQCFYELMFCEYHGSMTGLPAAAVKKSFTFSFFPIEWVVINKKSRKAPGETLPNQKLL